MSNVSFGGDWSEELVEAEKVRDILLNLDWAVENCMDRDVRTEAVLGALLYVRKNVEKGAMHCESFIRACTIEDQNIRHQELSFVVKRIYQFAGVY